MKIFHIPTPFPKANPRRTCHRTRLFPPGPRPFDFGFTQRRPLASLPMVTTVLNRPCREIMLMLEDGRLRWAFDIRSRHAHRREVRVLWQSLIDFIRLWPRPVEVKHNEAEEFLEVVKLVLSEGMPGPAATPSQPLASREPVLTGTEVAQCFSCRSEHVLNLIREESLQALAVELPPKASPLVTRASVVTFLKQRRIS